MGKKAFAFQVYGNVSTPHPFLLENTPFSGENVPFERKTHFFKRETPFFIILPKLFVCVGGGGGGGGELPLH